MRHLVLGGTGTVGSAVVTGLLAKGESVRVATRSAEKAAALPAGATPALGDLTDPTTYEALFADFDSLFLLNGVTATELQEGLAAVNEARRAGARRLVYLSVHDAEKGAGIPHFASKLAIEEAIRQSGIPAVVLRPNNFYQNDLWYRDAMLSWGVYPQPIGAAGLSRVDVRDIADAAVRALTEEGFEGRTYALVGPDVLSGETCAAAWSAALGRAVRYAGDDLESWYRQTLAYLPAWMAYDFRLMYGTFQCSGLAATLAQLAETETLLGRPPRRFADFTRETAEGWK